MTVVICLTFVDTVLALLCPKKNNNPAQNVHQQIVKAANSRLCSNKLFFLLLSNGSPNKCNMIDTNTTANAMKACKSTEKKTKKKEEKIQGVSILSHITIIQMFNLPTPIKVPNVPIATIDILRSAITPSHHSLPSRYPMYNKPYLV